MSEEQVIDVHYTKLMEWLTDRQAVAGKKHPKPYKELLEVSVPQLVQAAKFDIPALKKQRGRLLTQAEEARRRLEESDDVERAAKARRAAVLAKYGLLPPALIDAFVPSASSASSAATNKDTTSSSNASATLAAAEAVMQHLDAVLDARADEALAAICRTLQQSALSTAPLSDEDRTSTGIGSGLLMEAFAAMEAFVGEAHRLGLGGGSAATSTATAASTAPASSSDEDAIAHLRAAVLFPVCHRLLAVKDALGVATTTTTTTTSTHTSKLVDIVLGNHRHHHADGAAGGTTSIDAEPVLDLDVDDAGGDVAATIAWGDEEDDTTAAGGAGGVDGNGDGDAETGVCVSEIVWGDEEEISGGGGGNTGGETCTAGEGKGRRGTGASTAKNEEGNAEEEVDPLRPREDVLGRAGVAFNAIAPMVLRLDVRRALLDEIMSLAIFFAESARPLLMQEAAASGGTTSSGATATATSSVAAETPLTTLTRLQHHKQLLQRLQSELIAPLTDPLTTELLRARADVAHRAALVAELERCSGAVHALVGKRAAYGRDAEASSAQAAALGPRIDAMIADMRALQQRSEAQLATIFSPHPIYIVGDLNSL